MTSVRPGAPAVAEWHAWLLARSGEVRRAVEGALDGLRAEGIDLPFAGDSLPLTPAVLPAAWTGRLEAGCRAIFEGIEAVFHGRFGGDAGRLADFLLFAPGERALLELGAPGDWAVTARPDFIAGPGGPAVIETNVTTSLGLFECGVLGRVVEAIPGWRALAGRHGLTTVDPGEALADAVAAAPAGGDAAFVAVVDDEDEMPRWGYLCRYLANGLAARGIAAEVATLQSLDVSDEGVFLGGRRVSTVYRFFSTIALRGADGAASQAPLLAAVRDGRVAVFGGFRHKLFTPKLFLALLSDEENADVLPSGVRAAVAAVVPWTRILADRATTFEGRRVDLLELVTDCRERFVLKPNLGFGGRGVSIGAVTDPSRWEQLLREALAADEHWLVQERVETPVEELAFLQDGEVVLSPALVDYGVFMVERRFAGVARRNATAATGPNLTNLSRGGGLAATWFSP